MSSPLSSNDDYDNVITAIGTLNTEVTMDFVESRLLDEELKIKSKNTDKITKQNEIVFKSNYYVCYKCGQSGHKLAVCRANRGEFRGRIGNRGIGSNRGHNSRGRTIARNEYAHQTKDKNSLTLIALNSQRIEQSINCFIQDWRYRKIDYK
ncbi:hypothetical protein WA026_007692 [Henosepilachna vigintioctopunctata]|uniref:CCHC-type domain-containing protein n=1 Tax=Henosepilachna vigintioctopunctata TaxID=420089 RepID=A0AAW1U2Y7_9CUCU